MIKWISHKTHNIYPNLNDQQQFKLNKINEIKDYFVAEIKERELMSIYILCYSMVFLFYSMVAFLLHHLQLLLEHQ